LWYNKSMSFKRLKLHGVDEPNTDWTKLTSESDREWEWLKNMYWYRIHSSIKQQKSWVSKYLKAQGLDPKEYNHGKKRLFESAGGLCRILETGCPEDHKLINLLKMLLKEIKEESSKFSASTKASLKKSNHVSIQERMSDQLGEYMDEINGKIDWFLANPKMKKKEWFSIGKWLKDKKVKPTQTMHILKEIQPVYNEVAAAKNKECEQLVEAYDYLTAHQMFRYNEFLESMLKEIKDYMRVTKPKKATRKVSPEQAVKKLPFAEEFDELSIKSIDPTEILGSTALFVYNTTSRLMCVYVAFQNSGGLSVKGASITHFDPDKSYMKKCRSCQHNTRMVGKLTKKHALDHVDKITTKKQPVRPRLNKNCVILRAF